MAHVRARFSLLLLAIAACGGKAESEEPVFRAAQGPNPFEICATSTFGRYSRGVRCKDMYVLLVSRDVSPDALLQGTRINLESYGFTPEAFTLRVNGREQPALEYKVGRADKPLMHQFMTALAVPGSGESIEARCYSYVGEVEPVRCQTVLDGFIQQGLYRGEWPRALATSPPRESLSLDLAGREVRLPSSCSELGPFDIDCQDGHVRVLAADIPEKLPKLLETDLEITRDDTLIGERTVPCSLEGVATTCTLRRSRLPYSDELLGYRATAVVRKQALLVSCDVKKTRATPEPGPICNQFFRFEEGVLQWPTAPVD
jgi:hypothetical protein